MTAKHRIAWRHTATGQGGSTPYFYPQLAADEIARVANSLAPDIHHSVERESCRCIQRFGTGVVIVRDSGGKVSTFPCRSVHPH